MAIKLQKLIDNPELLDLLKFPVQKCKCGEPLPHPDLWRTLPNNQVVCDDCYFDYEYAEYMHSGRRKPRIIPVI